MEGKGAACRTVIDKYKMHMLCEVKSITGERQVIEYIPESRQVIEDDKELESR